MDDVPSVRARGTKQSIGDGVEKGGNIMVKPPIPKWPAVCDRDHGLHVFYRGAERCQCGDKPRRKA